MFPKSKKEKCKIAIKFLCKEQISVANVFKTKDSLLKKRDKFHFQLSNILESFEIRYDDVFEVFDELWQCTFEGRERDFLHCLSSGIGKSRYCSIMMTFVASDDSGLYRFVDEAMTYSKRYEKYVKLIETTLLDYVDKYEDGEGRGTSL